MDGARDPRLGLDIGRVLIAGPQRRAGGDGHGDGYEDGHEDGHEDTAFFDGDEAAMLRTPAVEGAFAAARRLTGRFEGRVWLVSKCSERVQRRSLRWLDHHGFWESTGVRRDAVRFCLQRHEKAGIAAELGLTHFVDDRVDVHAALRGVVPHRFLFGASLPVPGDPTLVATPTWADAERAIAATLAGPGGPARRGAGAGPGTA